MNQENVQGNLGQFSQSDSITELIKALVKVQAEMPTVIKGQTNPFFQSKYADLATIWTAASPLLEKYGLAIAQPPSGNGVTTQIMHISGEWIRSTMNMHIVPSWDKKTETNIITPHAHGSAITYARRYMLQGLLGVCPVDDDGEAAMSRSEKPTVASGKPPDFDAMTAAHIKAIDKIQLAKAIVAYWKKNEAAIMAMPQEYHKQVQSALTDKRKELNEKQEQASR